MSFLLIIRMIVQYYYMCQAGRKFIANNIKKYRKIRSLNQEQLALLIEYDNSYISKVENCKVNVPIDTLEKLAEILDIKLVNLFE